MAQRDYHSSEEKAARQRISQNKRKADRFNEQPAFLRYCVDDY
jgi:hypothetical protein